MKKTLLLIGLCSCLLMCGCAKSSDGQGDLTKPPSTTLPSDTQTQQETTDTAQTKLQYYEELVKQLQEELLQIKTERYIEQITYDSKIELLEQTVEALKVLQDVGNVTPPSETLPFTYQIENGTVRLLSYTGAAKRVEIPATVENLPVTALGDRLFQNCTSIEEVTVPNGVKSIGWFVFSGCVSLKTVEIPASVTVIYYGVFENCPATLTVKCAKDSYSEAYAKSYGIRTVNT